MKIISERRALVNELFVVFSLLAVIVVSSYAAVEFLTSEKVIAYIKSLI